MKVVYLTKYPKKHLLPPESGPTPHGMDIKYDSIKVVTTPDGVLNIHYNPAKTVKQSGEKINGRHRQSASKRSIRSTRNS